MISKRFWRKDKAKFKFRLLPLTCSCISYLLDFSAPGPFSCEIEVSQVSLRGCWEGDPWGIGWILRKCWQRPLHPTTWL